MNSLEFDSEFGIITPSKIPVKSPPKCAQLLILNPGKNPKANAITVNGSKSISPKGKSLPNRLRLKVPPISNPTIPNILAEAPSEKVSSLVMREIRYESPTPPIPPKIYVMNSFLPS